MYLFPLLIVDKKNQNILDPYKKQLEINIKITNVKSIKLFIKDELKYYEYITHIIIDIDYVEEKNDDFVDAIASLYTASDVPIIIYADKHVPGDRYLSEIAHNGYANIIGDTPRKVKTSSKKMMIEDMREALIRSNSQNRIGLRPERQMRFDTNYTAVITNDVRDYNKIRTAIAIMGAGHRVGTTTFAMQLADYFATRGAKVAFFSRAEDTDNDLIIIKSFYKDNIIDNGKFFTYRNIDFFAFGRKPDKGAWNYNVLIYETGTDVNLFNELQWCSYRYIVSGMNIADLLQLKSFLTPENNTPKIITPNNYRVIYNFGTPQMCNNLYNHIQNDLIPNCRTAINKFVPYKFNLPPNYVEFLDDQFNNWKNYIIEEQKNENNK